MNAHTHRSWNTIHDKTLIGANAPEHDSSTDVTGQRLHNALHLDGPTHTAPTILEALKTLTEEALDLADRYDEEEVIGTPMRRAIKDAIHAIAQAETQTTSDHQNDRRSD